MKKLLLLFLLASCATNPDLDYLDYGFAITNDSGLQVGVWGNYEFPPQVTGATFNQSYPNPSSSATTFRFYLAEESDVELWVTRVDRSNRITTLLSDVRSKGEHEVSWSYRASGNEFMSGFYTVHLSVNNESTLQYLYIGEPDQSRSEMIEYLESIE